MSPRTPRRLVDREPDVSRDELVAALVPPPRFADVRFATYLPDPAQASQAAAVARLRDFASQATRPPRRSLLRRRAAYGGPGGIYLDGGYGVGKTHLLASLWHAVPGPKAYATFVELTNLVGVLGFADTVAALGAHRLVCIDEFELDDPGDTVLMSSLLDRLVGSGVRLAATSNTLPGRLGADRFAAEDFLREIQSLSAHFDVVRIDGEDYRHRGLPSAPRPLDDEAVVTAGSAAGATLDDFPELLQRLARVHPARYAALVCGVEVVCLRGVAPLEDQNTALRLVVLVDRLYDADVPVVASGVPVDAIFPAEMLAGGYAKKYRRAVSRLVALARAGEALARRTA